MDKYDLEYWIGSRKVETLEVGKPMAVCRWRADVLKDGKSHSLGKFKFRKNK